MNKNESYYRLKIDELDNNNQKDSYELISDTSNLMMTTYQFAPNNFMDVSDIKQKMILTPVDGNGSRVADEKPTNDWAIIEYKDSRDNEIIIDRVDQNILIGIHTVFYQEGSPQKYAMPISSLIRECYGYKTSQTINEKEYNEFMNRLFKLSNIFVTINFSERNMKRYAEKNKFVDPTNGHVMTTLKGRLLNFVEVTNKTSSSKDWIVLDKPLDYNYSINKEHFMVFNKELLHSSKKGRRSVQYRNIKTYLLQRVMTFKRSKKKNGENKYQSKILWETLFKECQLQDKSPTQKSRIRQDVTSIFQEWKEIGFIVSFEPYGPEGKKTSKGIQYELNFDYQLQV